MLEKTSKVLDYGQQSRIQDADVLMSRVVENDCARDKNKMEVVMTSEKERVVKSATR